MRAAPHVFLLCTFLCQGVPAQQPAWLEAKPLDWQGDLSARMVEGISRFLDQETKTAAAERDQFWSRDFASAEAYQASIESRRDRLRTIIGAVDPRVSVERVEFTDSTAAPALLAETPAYSIWVVRWPVLEGVHGEGLWLRPKTEGGPWVIALPDADQTPETLAGLEPGIGHAQQFARRLAEAGCEVFIPVLIDRGDRHSGNEELNRFTNQPHREWIYRQAYQMGRHIIGYEVQKVLALVDWISSHAPGGGSARIGVAGYGEGGLTALHAAALDVRIGSTLVSGYFAPREDLWREPIYRNLFGSLREFGDAEIASLIAPRHLVIEYSAHPAVEGPPARRAGRSGAAPGVIATPERYEVEEEFHRTMELFPANLQPPFHFVYGNEGNVTGPGSEEALRQFSEGLGLEQSFEDAPTRLPGPRARVDGQARQLRQIRELERFTQGLLLRSERVRDQQFWTTAGSVSPDEWVERSEAHKRPLWEEVLGKFENAYLELNPRARRVYDEPLWTGYEVVLDVWPEVFAWGILLVPKDIAPGERRPVVVCQHGLEGVPADVVEGPENAGYRAYKAYAARLAERGFITFAPHNPYRGEDKFRVLQRKANPIGRSLFSVILGQHEQILRWLSGLPMVDSERIAFYGLSYGGKTAMRVPPLLNGYCLSICSADFNEWIKKNVTVHSPYSYMFTGEYEMPEFNLGHTFNYAEMAALIAPRPFMVERGHDDGVAPDEWVAYEFAKVRRHYSRLGIADKAEIEFFPGPHTINGEGTFEFLHRHLNWPSPPVQEP